MEKVSGPARKIAHAGRKCSVCTSSSEQLHVPWIGLPIVNHDNNQHAANENYVCRILWDGIELMAALMRL